MKNILLIDTSYQEDSLFTLEYIMPVYNTIKDKLNQIKIIHYSKINKKKLINIDKIIICGTGLKDNLYLENLNKFNWIKETNIPIFGICAGAQIIAKIFKEEIEKKQEIGIFTPKIIKTDIILSNVNLKEIYSIHNNSIKTHHNFNIILKTTTPQLLKHKSKNIYLTLFHPEIKNKKIIQNFIHLN